MTRIKGLKTTAEHLPYDEYLNLLEGLHKDGLYMWEVYCIISFCTAFRVTDVRELSWRMILDRDEIMKLEKKTQKGRSIPVNEDIRKSIREIYELLKCPDKNLPVICNPQTRLPYSLEYINRKLKWFKFKYKLRIKHFSTHTFRKTFGHYVYEYFGRTPEALILLNEIFNHRNIDVTKRYIGITRDDINKVYNSLSLSVTR